MPREPGACRNAMGGQHARFVQPRDLGWLGPTEDGRQQRPTAALTPSSLSPPSAPPSQEVTLTATVHTADRDAAGLQGSSGPLLQHPWQRQLTCNPTAAGASCNATLPATGLAVLQLRLPGGAANGRPPQPCSLAVKPVFSPSLLVRCVLGVWLMLFAHRAVASRPGQAALRLCSAAAQAAAPWRRQLRAALAAELAGAGALAVLRAHAADWSDKTR